MPRQKPPARLHPWASSVPTVRSRHVLAKLPPFDATTFLKLHHFLTTNKFPLSGDQASVRLYFSVLRNSTESLIRLAIPQFNTLGLRH